MLRRSTRLLVVAVGLIAAVIAVSPVAAGTGFGALFNLGRTNTVNGTSYLVGTTTGRMLSITNKGTGAALYLGTRTGVAPMVVSSSTKVIKLNADLLDGLHSSAFLMGKGSRITARATLGFESYNNTILMVPGVGSIEAGCGREAAPTWRLGYHNGPDKPTDVWFNGSLAPGYYAAAPDAATWIAVIDEYEPRVVEVTVGSADGHVTEFSIAAQASPAGCLFYASAIGG
jgi:hypothetical protein